MILESEIQNGFIWEAPHPFCWQAISQWLDRDGWVLLSGPSNAIHGGTCHTAHSIFISPGEHKIIVTKSELCEYLNRLPWKRTELRCEYVDLGKLIERS